DLLGMERRQAEQIRDLERGHFLALGPAVSRKPVAVRIGAVRTSPRTVLSGLMPLPEAPAQDMFALLHEGLEDEPERRPEPPVPEDVETADVLLGRISTGDAILSGPLDPATDEDGEDIDYQGEIDEILFEIAGEDGATFQPASALYQDFTVRCRMRRVPPGLVDLAAFRRRFAMALAGMSEVQSDGGTHDEVLGLARKVPDDLLAPFLVIARAAIDEAPCPDDDELARVYGTSSPGRIRRLLDHLEKSGLIVLRTDFGGRRSVGIPGLGLSTAPLEA
ncbi:MAG: ATP-binding protein, partial [Novosphingobium sp.]|nr:ATP-binding protein [Novosphingobium sp.]